MGRWKTYSLLDGVITWEKKWNGSNFLRNYSFGLNILVRNEDIEVKKRKKCFDCSGEIWRERTPFLFSSFLPIQECWGGNRSSLPRFSHDQKIPRIHTLIDNPCSSGNSAIVMEDPVVISLSLSLGTALNPFLLLLLLFFSNWQAQNEKIALSGDLKGDFESRNKGKGIMETLTLLGEIETIGKFVPQFLFSYVDLVVALFDVDVFWYCIGDGIRNTDFCGFRMLLCAPQLIPTYWLHG